jgi:hypothetical protein
MCDMPHEGGVSGSECLLFGMAGLSVDGEGVEGGLQWGFRTLVTRAAEICQGVNDEEFVPTPPFAIRSAVSDTDAR